MLENKNLLCAKTSWCVPKISVQNKIKFIFTKVNNVDWHQKVNRAWFFFWDRHRLVFACLLLYNLNSAVLQLIVHISQKHIVVLVMLVYDFKLSIGLQKNGNNWRSWEEVVIYDLVQDRVGKSSRLTVWLEIFWRLNRKPQTVKKSNFAVCD